MSLCYLVRLLRVVEKLGDGFVEPFRGETTAVVLVVTEVLARVNVEDLHAAQPANGLQWSFAA